VAIADERFPFLFGVKISSYKLFLRSPAEKEVHTVIGQFEAGFLPDGDFFPLPSEHFLS